MNNIKNPEYKTCEQNENTETTYNNVEIQQKHVLNFDDIKYVLNDIGRDKVYNLLYKAYKTGKPFPVISKHPYRVPKKPFLDALNEGKIRI